MRKLVLGLVALMICGCGSAGSTSTATSAAGSATVSGVAATGAAIIGTVQIKDASGSQLALATTDGSYSFDVSHLKAPFMLKAAWGNRALYSFAAAPGTANITPLTHMIVRAAAGGAALDAVFETATQGSLDALAARLPAATAGLRANLKPLLAAYAADVDPINSAFAADGTGMDALLDHITLVEGTGTLTLINKATGTTLSSMLSADLTRGVSTLAWDAALANQASDPEVKVAEDGRGLALWWQYGADRSTSSIMAKWQDGAATRISAGTGFAMLPQVALDASGNAVACWVQYEGTTQNLWANRYASGTGWGTPVKLTSLSGSNAASYPSLGIDGAGNALISWYQQDVTINSNHFDVYLIRFAAATATWSAPALISDGVKSAYRSKVAVNPSGRATIAWIQALDDGSASNGAAEVRAVTGSATGEFAPSVTVNTLPGGTFQVYGQIALALDQAGATLLAWVQSSSGGHFDIWTSRHAAGGIWEAPAPVSDGTTGECYGPDVAFDSNGGATLVWAQQSDREERQYVAASRYTAGSGWSAPTVVSQNTGNGYDPHVAVDATGLATAVWYQVEDTGVTIHSSRYLPGIGWCLPLLVATASGDGFGSYPVPRVSANANGQSLIIWGTDY